MISKKFNKIFLLLVLLFMVVSVVSATDTDSDATSTDNSAINTQEVSHTTDTNDNSADTISKSDATISNQQATSDTQTSSSNSVEKSYTDSQTTTNKDTTSSSSSSGVDNTQKSTTSTQSSTTSSKDTTSSISSNTTSDSVINTTTSSINESSSDVASNQTSLNNETSSDVNSSNVTSSEVSSSNVITNEVNTIANSDITDSKTLKTDYEYNPENYTYTVYDFYDLDAAHSDIVYNGTTEDVYYINIVPNSEGYFIIENPIVWGIPGQSIERTVILEGNGEVITDVEHWEDRLFTVRPGFNLTINNLIIDECNKPMGAGIYNMGNLTLNHCAFTNNTAEQGAAICSNADTNTVINDTLFIDNSVTMNGGAIFNQGNMTINNSIFINNTNQNTNDTYSYGGAINNHGNLNISDSTFESNLADDGGAIYSTRSGGCNVTIINTTFTENTAVLFGGALGIARSNVTIDNCTFTENDSPDGGAIYSTGNVSINNTNFIANNATERGGAVFNEENMTINGTYFADNWVYNNTENCYGGAYRDRGNSNITNSTFINNNAYYGYGGAIYQSGNTTIDNVTFTENTAVLGGAIRGEYQNLTINNSTFEGNSVTTVEGINARGGAIYSSGNMTVNDTKFKENKAISEVSGNNGGAIKIYGNATIENSTFTENTAGNGGAIHVDSTGKLNVKNVTFTGNTADEFSGALGNAYGTVSIENSTFTENKASWGGVINNNNGTLTISDSTFSNNEASLDSDGEGGVILNDAGTVTIADSRFTNNMATHQGGVINSFVYEEVIGEAIVTIKNSNFTSNSATRGGVLDNYEGSTITVTDCLFTSNEATYGGVICNKGTVNVDGSTNFTENSATYGGVIRNNGTVNVGGSTNFTENSATYGGVICNNGTVNVDGAIFDQNSADYGGAIGNIGILSVSDSNFTSNTATQLGGAIIDANTTELTGNTFTDNAGEYDETIYTVSENLDMSDNTFSISYYHVTAYETQTIYSPIIDAYDSSNILFVITLPDGLTETIDSKVDSEGRIYIEYSFRIEGVYLVDIVYKKENNTIESVVDVDKLESKIELVEFDPTVTSDFEISGYLTDKDGNAIESYDGLNVLVYIDGQVVETVVPDSTGYFSTSGLSYSLGEHSLKVEFEGNDGITACTAEETFDVRKEQPTITIDPYDNPAIDEDLTISFKLVDEENEPIEDASFVIIINGQRITDQLAFDENTGTYSFTYTPTEYGIYYVSIYYVENDYYYDCFESNTFSIDYKTAVIDIIDHDDVNVTETVTITGKLYDADDESPIKDTTLTVYINNIRQTETVDVDSNGDFTYNYIPEKEGTYTVTLLYNDDYSEYTTTSATTTFTASRTNTLLDVDVENTVIGRQLTVIATLTDDSGNKLSDETVSLLINNDYYTLVTDSNGQITFTTDYTLTAGFYTIIAVYNGTDVYNGVYSSGSFELRQIDEKLSVELTSGTYVGDEFIFTGSLTDLTTTEGLAGATITISIYGENDTSTRTTDTQGEFTYSFYPLKAGTYVLTFEFIDETGEYASAVQTVVVDAVKKDTTIELNVEDTIVNTTVTITGKLTYNENGIEKAFGDVILDVTINGQTISQEVKTDSNGEYSFTYTPTSIETYVVEVRYSGDDYYNSATKSDRFLATQKGEKFEITPTSGTYVNDEFVFDGYLLEEDDTPIVGATIVVTINGVTQSDDIKTGSSGEFTYEFIPTESGTYTVTFDYIDSEGVHTSASRTKTVNVIKKDTTVTVTAEDCYVGQSITVSGVLTYVEYGVTYNLAYTDLTVTINNRAISDVRTGPNGEYSFTYTPTSAGTFTIEVYYDGDNVYNSDHTATTFEATQRYEKLTAENTEGKYVLDDFIFTGQLVDSTSGEAIVGATITVSINGKQQTDVITTETNGEFTYSFKPTESGIYTVVFEFTDPEGVYSSASVTVVVNVFKKNTVISEIVSSTEDIKINSTVTISGTLTESDGVTPIAEAIITATVNGVEVTDVIKTDSNGNYSFTYTPTYRGTFTVEVYYDGDSIYNGDHKATTFDTRKLYTEIDVNIVEDNNIYDVDTVSGTLLDENGNPVANAEIFVTVNGEEYIEYTDESGVYTHNINVVGGGSYYIVIFYEGDDYYYGTHARTTFYLPHKVAEITIDDIPTAAMSSTVDITGSLIDLETNEPITGATIIVDVNGEILTTHTDSDGRYTVQYTPTDSGLFIVTAVFIDENNDYSTVTAIGILQVDKIETSISVYYIGTTSVGETITISGELLDVNGNPISNAIITVIIDDDKITTTTDANGGYSLGYTIPYPNEYNIVVIYDGDDSYYGSNNNCSFNVESDDTQIQVTVDEDVVYVSKDATFTITLLDNDENPITGAANDDFEISINGESYTTSITEIGNGQYTFTYAPDKEGLYIVSVTYSHSPDHDPDKTSVVFNAVKIQTSITVKEITDQKLNNNITIEGVLTDLYDNSPIANAEIVITVNSETFTNTTNDKGEFSLQYNVTKTGSYSIIVLYEGNVIYESSHNSTTFNLNIQTLTISIDTDDTQIVDHQFDITGTVYADGDALANALVTVTINGEDYTVETDSDGVYTFPFTPEYEGVYHVTVSFNDDTGGYLNYTISKNITVSKLPVILNVTASDGYIKDTIEISGILVDATTEEPIVNAEIHVTVGTEVISGITTGNDGKFSFTYTPTSTGTYIVEVYYEGDHEYNSDANLTSFVISQKEAQLDVSQDSGNHTLENFVFNGQLTDKTTGSAIVGATIDITVNGEVQPSQTTDNEGKFTFTYEPQSIGAYTIVFSYTDENGIYQSVTKTITINTGTTDTIITVNQIPDTQVGNSVTITGTLTDSDGNVISNERVIVVINGQSRAVNTNQNGVYSTTYTVTDATTYTVTVIYEGSSAYDSAFASTTFKGIETSSLLTIDPISDIKINQSVNITGSLKDAEGNPLSQKTVTITVNGETFTRTTDEDGKYLLEYKPSSAGSYAVLVEFIDEGYSLNYVVSAFTTYKLETTITVSNATGIEGETVNLTAYVVNENGNPVSEGQVAFKMNDVLIKDADGNVIYVDVIDGVATLPYTINNTAKNYTLLALYYGSDNYYTAKSDYSTFTVEKAVLSTRVEVEDITAEYGDTIELVAQVFDEYGNVVTTGKVVFKLNGVSLKNDKGDVIYVDIDENGYARYNYTITNNPKLYTITAVYSGDGRHVTSRNTTATLNVTNRIVDITVDIPSGEIKAGDTVQLKATITEEDMTYTDNGVVVFKINGVTIRDESGNSIKVNVTDGVATLDYTIPEGYSAKDYTITAVYSNKNYDRAEANTTMTLSKSDVYANISPLTITQGTNTTISTQLYDEHGSEITQSTKVAIKVNGKTLLHTTTTETGKLDVTIPTDTFTNSEYDVSIVFGENSSYNEYRLNTTLNVVS